MKGLGLAIDLDGGSQALARPIWVDVVGVLAMPDAVCVCVCVSRAHSALTAHPNFCLTPGSSHASM